MSRRFLLAALVVLVSVLVAGCGGGSKSSESGGETEGGGAKKNVTLQLKWVTQAQFAGFYAAAAKGYYKQFGLDVTIKPGGPDITPEQVVASGQAEFGLDWLPSLPATRDMVAREFRPAAVAAKYRELYDALAVRTREP